MLHAKLTSAISLIVEVIFFNYGDSSFAESAFAPVLCPVGDVREVTLSE